MKKFICLFTLFLLVGLGLNAKDLKLGLAVAQTGGLAPFDAPVVEGIELAIDEINAKGGIMNKIKIVPLYRDVRSETAATGIAASELINEKVNILITPCDADPSFAVVSIVNKAKIPAISTCATAPTLPLLGGKYMFLNAAGDQYQAAVSAEYAQEMGYKTAYLLYSPDSQYTKLPLYFEKSFTKLGGKVVGKATYKLDQQDFSALIANLKRIKPAPDVIMTSAYEPSFPAFIRSLRSAGIKSKVIGSDGIDSPTVVGLGSAVEGVVFTTHGISVPGNNMEKFEKAYKKKFGKESETVFNALGYDLIKVIEAAVIDAKGKMGGDDLRNALANLKNVKGATGNISYKGGDRIPLKDITLVEIRSGKKMLVKQSIPSARIVAEPTLSE